jgi:hypothetical protein
VFRRDEAEQMRAEGKGWREIAAALNVPASTVRGVCGKSPRISPPFAKQSQAATAGA